MLYKRSKKISYVHVKQKKATNLKTELKIFLLSCIIYTNTETY